jgi:hypothetical protein
MKVSVMVAAEAAIMTATMGKTLRVSVQIFSRAGRLGRDYVLLTSCIILPKVDHGFAGLDVTLNRPV